MAVLALTSSAHALTIEATFDITLDRRSPIAKATIKEAITFYEHHIFDPVTVRISFNSVHSGLASSYPQWVAIPYSQYRAALVSHADSVDDATSLAHLPTTQGNPVNGDDYVFLNTPLARALGLYPDINQSDGTIELNLSEMNLSAAETDPSKYSLFAATCHEIDEILGTESALNIWTNGTSPSGAVCPSDLFRYFDNGYRSYTKATSVSSFFSLDGVNALARFNQKPPGDYGDWYSPEGHQPIQVQDAYATAGTAEIPGVELRVLDVIGYSRVQHIIYVDRNNSCYTFDDLPVFFRSYALANPPPGLEYGTENCVTHVLDPPFPNRPPNYPADWPWGVGLSYPNDAPPGYPADWPWPPYDPPPTPFGLGGPFRVISNAVDSAVSSAHVRVQIKTGHYDEQFRITKSLTLSASGGPVFIGKP